jgi:hypothetical protein
MLIGKLRRGAGKGVTGKDRYRLGRYSFTHDPGGQQRQSAAAQQAYSTYVLSQERWDNYRREADHLVVPIREMALAADKAAVDLAQSALKTSVLINVGGFVAIQAAVPLFKLEPASIQWPLISTGFWFGGGLVAAWISHGFGFLALAHAADRATFDAEATRYLLLEEHFPDDKRVAGWRSGRTKLEKQVRWRRLMFLTMRGIAILLFWASVVLFFVGARRGVCTIVAALPPPIEARPVICRSVLH